MINLSNKIRGKKLQYYREFRNLTQEHVAERIGVNPTTYGRYEKGEHEPKLDQWEKIAELLEVPVEELLRLDPIVINMQQSHMGFNFGSMHNQYPVELVNKLIDQFEARIQAVERSAERLEKANEQFMDLVKELIKSRG